MKLRIVKVYTKGIKMEYTDLEMEQCSVVFNKLYEGWHSKSDLRYELNIFDCSKVLYNLINILDVQKNYVIVSRKMHGYIYKGQDDCREYEFDVYSTVPRDNISYLGQGVRVVKKYDLDYNPNKKKAETFSVPIEEDLPLMEDIFEELKRYNNKSKSYYNQDSQFSVRSHDNNRSITFSSVRSRPYRFKDTQEELDWHTDSFLDSMLDIEDCLDDSGLF